MSKSIKGSVATCDALKSAAAKNSASGLPAFARLHADIARDEGGRPCVLRRVDAQGRQSVVRINPPGRAILEKRWAQAAGFVIDLLAAYAEEKFERLLDLLLDLQSLQTKL